MDESKVCGVVPSPKGWWGTEKLCFADPSIFADAFTDAAKTFCRYAKKALGIAVEISQDSCACIRLVRDNSLSDGEYRLSACASTRTITLFAAGSCGIHYGLATLLQLCCARDGKLMLPEITVCDKPESDWRGLLVDCARSRHSVDCLKKYIDLCWLYKINRLHLHLSDDEAYTLPSFLFPDATTEGMGYTAGEIKELNSYARERGVMIVPEVDTPGHTTALREKYPDLFGRNGIICFHREAINAVKDIYGEVCELFPDSEYIHTGGDESRLGWWLDCDKCADFGQSLGILPDDKISCMTDNEYIMLRYLAHFIGETADAVSSLGRKPVVWEGFHKITNEMLLDKNITVMSWDNSFQAAPSLLSDGFRLINCSWLPNYIVTPVWFYPQKDCFDWDIYSFGSITEGSPYYNMKARLSKTDMISGGQLCSWGDSILQAFPTLKDGLADELSKICERLPALAENTWNRDKRVTYDAFKTSYEKANHLAEAVLK